MSAKVLDTDMVKVTELHPYPGNARRGDVDVIAKSLEVHGQYKPIVVQGSTGYVLAGNHTLEAATRLGWTEILVTTLDCDDDTARKINLIDNRSNDVAGYDDEALAALLNDLEGDFAGSGFEQDDLDELLKGLQAEPGSKGDTTAADLGALGEQVTQPGDIWILGEHRLMCGSASDAGALEILANGEKVDLFITSPPYNQKLETFKASGMRKEGSNWIDRMAGAYSDSMPEPEYQKSQVEVLDGLSAIAAPHASFFYNHKPRYRDKQVILPVDWLRELEHWAMRQEIVWDRCGAIALNARMFMPHDERIYWLTLDDDFVFDSKAKIKAWGTIWRITQPIEIKVSAPFPIELPERAMRACANPGSVVMDPYAGTGTVLIAAENLGHRGLAMEINPAYCDVIVDRWQRHTGRKAERQAI